MKILICGASGFIGRHLAQTLRDAGHQIWHGERQPQGPFALPVDYRQDLSSTIWRARVRGMDVVINAVGILHGSEADFHALHTQAPCALFDACMQTGVKRFIQISALAPAAPAILPPFLPPFLASKHAADAHMLAACAAAHAAPPGTALATPAMHCLVVRPSLVTGIDGDSSQLFRSLASLPLLFLPGKGEQPLQPVQIQDVCDAIKNWIEQAHPGSQIINAVGPKAISYRAMLARYRKEMGLPPAMSIALPMPLMRAAGKLASRLPPGLGGMAGAALAPANLQMLEAGNTAEPDAFNRLLGRAQQQSWLAGLPPACLRQAAIATWSVPLFRLALAALWWFTAIVSAWLYPLADGLALLGPLGLPHKVALAMLYGAAALDFSLGLATLLWPSRRLWWLQILLILGYTLIISVTLPAFWLHPFGPVLKNLPILAMLFYLLAQETRS